MKKILLLILFFITSSCFKSDIVQSQTANIDPATMHNGQVYPTAPRSYTNFCAVPKNCKFYLNTITHSGQIQKIILVILQVSDS